MREDDSSEIPEGDLSYVKKTEFKKYIFWLSIMGVLIIVVLLFLIIRNKGVDFLCVNDLDCDDNNSDTVDTCINPSTKNATCKNELIICSGCQYLENGVCKDYVCCDNLGCDDNNSDTVDTCINPSTKNATCRNELIICSGCQYLENGVCKDYVCCSDLDCDDNNSDTVDTCINPSTKNAICQHEEINSVSFIEKDFIVDKLTYRNGFKMFWLPEEGYLDEDFYLELISPSGDLIDNSLCAETNGACYDIEDYNIYHILNYDNMIVIEFQPIEYGHWQAKAFYPSDFNFYPWDLNSDCVSNIYSNLIIDWQFDSGDYTVGDPVIITAILGVLGNLVVWDDTEMSMDITTIPGGDYYAGLPLIGLNDNGEGYDIMANDGIYTVAHEDTSEAGSYCFRVIAEGENEIAGEYKREFEKCTYVREE